MQPDGRLALLLLPGLDGTGALFAPFVAELSPQLAPVVVRLPERAGPSYDDLVAAIRAQLPTDRPFALLAESFSGPVALRLAAARPAGLRALVLVASFHRRPARPWLAALAALAPLASLALARPPPAWAARRLLAGDDAPAPLVAALRAAIRETAPAVLAARIRTALAVDATRALADCRVPILSLAGARDRLLRRAIQDELGAIQPRVEAQVLDAPHLVLQRRPREAARIVGSFLARSARR